MRTGSISSRRNERVIGLEEVMLAEYKANSSSARCFSLYPTNLGLDNILGIRRYEQLSNTSQCECKNSQQQ